MDRMTRNIIQKTFTLIWLLTTFCLSAHSQAKNDASKPFKKKTATKAIAEQVKSDNYAKAYELFGKYEKEHAELKSDADYQNTGVGILHSLVLAENKNLYLKSKPDTAKYFGYIYDMYSRGMLCDSLEMACIETEGKGKYKYRGRNGGLMNKFRPNLRMASKYFYKKEKYAEAFKFAEIYINTIGAPIITKEEKTHSSSSVEKMTVDRQDSIAMSKVAVLSAYAAGKYGDVKKYLVTALADTAGRREILELGIKSQLADNDTLSAIKYLENAIAYYPERTYFYVTLIQLYDDSKRYEDALKITNMMIRDDSTKHLLWVIKGKEETSLNRQDSAIASFKVALNLKPTDAESASNIGVLLLNKIHEDKEKSSYTVGTPHFQKTKQATIYQYQQACKYLEMSKTNAPDRRDLWINGLRECYFKLNKGKSLKELEELNKTK